MSGNLFKRNNNHPLSLKRISILTICGLSETPIKWTKSEIGTVISIFHRMTQEAEKNRTNSAVYCHCWRKTTHTNAYKRDIFSTHSLVTHKFPSWDFFIQKYIIKKRLAPFLRVYYPYTENFFFPSFFSSIHSLWR